jgi:hypothetical protein
MAYLVAWGVYLAMAALLVVGFERYLAGYISHRRSLVFARSVLGIGLFTPGVVDSEAGVYVVPACIGVLFNVLARSGPGVMKAALPLLLAGVLVFGVLYLLEALRAGKPAATAD